MRIAKEFKKLGKRRTRQVETIPVTTSSVGVRFGLEPMMPKGDCVTLAFLAYREPQDETVILNVVMTSLEAKNLALRLTEYAEMLDRSNNLK